MFTTRTTTVFFGLLVILTLVVPTVAAVHISSFTHVWSDTGVNTRLIQNDYTSQWNMPRADQYTTNLDTWLFQNGSVAWNDAGLNTSLTQAETTGWSDIRVSVTRIENHRSGWNDAGAGVGLF